MEKIILYNIIHTYTCNPDISPLHIIHWSSTPSMHLIVLAFFPYFPSPWLICLAISLLGLAEPRFHPLDLKSVSLQFWCCVLFDRQSRVTIQAGSVGLHWLTWMVWRAQRCVVKSGKHSAAQVDQPGDFLLDIDSSCAHRCSIAAGRC